ncbi:hypothetical protein DYU11_13830 [Fibrisoma montanum]|uniref:Lipocalin-like domain-containing protein n=2 Tax=Fibrisoma montanum TaxID=2305895 RepID=A0A418MCD8_9BACT|nr:hypothetical protein DYU11_13830 [Fibrisoma montanum]
MHNMKTKISLRTTAFAMLLAIFLTGFLTGCEDDDGGTTPAAATQTEMLVGNSWRVSRVATPDGQTLDRNRLNVTTQVLYDLDMQFKADKTVRAVDKNTKQVINGGTWELVDDNRAIDVNVTGFKGKFPIVELTRSRKLILRQQAPVDGRQSDINLEFDPVL